ncbi:subtilisin-like serine protease [Purpureocillium lilacinum]|nr:subtilisin-like serine protease [Purpureocillium lilacinum]
MPGDTSAITAGKYIVKFRDDIPDAQFKSLMESVKEDADQVYTNVLFGFSVALDAASLERWRNHPDVDYVEPDSKITASGTIRQDNATWGLGRISARDNGESEYVFDETAGEGTCTYVLDSGIDDTHPEFEGRAEQIYSFITGEQTDGWGHGTLVAGIIGSKTYGVAKKTRLYGIKVMADRGGTDVSMLIAGADLVLRHMRTRSCPKGVFVNISISGGMSLATNQAVERLVKNDVFVGVAAGNDGKELADRSPATARYVCVVAGTNKNDTWYKASNYGRRVDILAPASEVESTTINGETAIVNGTSVAAPHVVGLAAYVRALKDIGAANLCAHLRLTAHIGKIKGVPNGTSNHLAFNQVRRDET